MEADRVSLDTPRVALLQEIGTTLASEQVARVLSLLSRASITTVVLAQARPGEVAFDAVLELGLEGGFRWVASSPEQRASQR
jgi:hypothetical protein